MSFSKWHLLQVSELSGPTPTPTSSPPRRVLVQSTVQYFHRYLVPCESLKAHPPSKSSKEVHRITPSSSHFGPSG